MFTHLHVHSWFSLGQGPSSPEALIDAAIRRGYTSLACTDSNAVYGAVEFQRAAEAAGIRPILGAHLVQGDEECVALAMNERGWGAICRAVTALHWADADAGVGGKNRMAPAPGADARNRESVPADATNRAADGNVSEPSDELDADAHPRTAGPGGRLIGAAAIKLSDVLKADRAGALILSASTAFLERIVARSGPADIYAELRPGKERHAVLATARRLGVLPVVTNAVMFAHPEDWARHRLLRAIALNTTLSALEDPSPTHPPAHPPAHRPDAWLKPSAELLRHFPDVPEAMDLAGELADRCRYRIPIGRIIPPRYAEATDAFQQLRTLAYHGALRRYGTIAPITRDRLEHELGIIGMKGFADYFLVVKDIVEHGPTHCGRGSVANSVVSYCLGITHVEPLGAGLLFERFLNPERKDPPDIDLDFPWDERDRILAWVFQRYPRPQAAMVANHNTLKLRGALREVAKVAGRPEGEIREVTRRIPWYSDAVPIEQLLVQHPNFAGLDLPATWLELARRATTLVGTPRHLSLHPGGVVIVPGALTDYVPIEPAAKLLDGYPGLTVPVIQFEKDGAEDAGLVKIDLLGNRSLAVIRDGIAMVRTNTGRQLDYTSAEAGEDAATRELFRTGRTMGVFYTESPASRQLCIKSGSQDFELLVLNTSIIRPASNRFIRIYLERLHGGCYEPLHESLRDVLSETFGVMVYQEDVVNVSAAFAGMPLATGDGLRKALSKKRPVKALAAYAEEFLAGAAALGRDPVVAQQVWHMVMSFAGYSFCKGHSCSYIQVAQQSAYLRAHYPAEFFAAVLSNGGGFYAPFAYVAEARRAGITMLPPDVNASDFRTTGTGATIQIGFQFIKGLSADAVDRILGARTAAQADARDHSVNGARNRVATGRVSERPDELDADAYPRTAAPEGNSVQAPERAEVLAFGLAPGREPFTSLDDFRNRTQLRPDDLRVLIKVGALDAIARGMTRPMLLWEVDKAAGRRERTTAAQTHLHAVQAVSHPAVLPEYSAERRRREELSLLGFSTDCHPMDLQQDRLRRFRLVPASALPQYIGQHVLCCGMLTTAKPVHTAKDEPMQFATFDDGHGLIETVLFPDVHRSRGHILFDQGPFIFRGKVEAEFGAVTVTVTHLDRIERMLAKLTVPGKHS